MSLVTSKSIWEEHAEDISLYLDQPRSADELAQLTGVRVSWIRLALTFASSLGLVRETYQKQKKHRNPVPLYDNPLRVDQFKKEPFHNFMIETLDDIIEELADRIQLYGFCKDHQTDPGDPFSPISSALCRTCWKCSIKERLSRAFLVELNRAFTADQKTGGGGRIQ